MQFVRMEVNRIGSSDQLQLGRLSPGLNAICGLNGSGKTTLLNWLRQITLEASAEHAWSHRLQGMQAPQFGTVELRNNNIDYLLNQSSSGQVTCKSPQKAALATPTALSSEQQRVFGELSAIQSGGDNVQRLETLARQLGLDHPTVNVHATERQSLLARQSEIQTRLRSLEGLRSTREGLLSRRGHLEAELHRVQRESQLHRGYGVVGDRTRLEDHRSALGSELRDVRAELAALERDIAGHKSGFSLRHNHHAIEIGVTYREQLERLDARLDRWRQTLRDLRSHRERLEHDATDARLDKQIGDQLSITKSPEPRAALRSLEAQLLSASQQLDALMDRHNRSFEAYSAQTSLPESLRNMQRDLYEVCQQLARQESSTASETLRQQATQLARAESELLQSVEKLIEERAALLRKIADDYHLSVDQLTLAFGDWCECHDHPHLTQWLLNEAPGPHHRNVPDQSGRDFYSDELRLWDARRSALLNRIAELESQLKDIDSQLVARRAPVAQTVRSETEVARDLDAVVSELHDLEQRDRLRVELDEIRRSLAKLPVEAVALDPFRQRVNKHVDGLFGATRNLNGTNGLVHSHTAVYLNGRSQSSIGNGRLSSSVSPQVPTSIVDLATRLAIAEAMLERNQPISLLVDRPFDHLPLDVQQRAMRHLESVAAAGQQIVLFSSDERVAELVRAAGGWVGYMHEVKAVRPVAKPVYAVQKPLYDVNRHLSAVANDHEAEKWYEPVVPKTRYVRRAHFTNQYHQLTEASLIEDCPSVDATAAARLRALGIDRVGDLLTTDPHWLAEHLRLSGVTSSTVMRWQAEAKLLCSVPQLRPFDARVLAGAGVRHPRQLAEMHPSQLLDRVERFLATDRGRDILRSGNSYELSRITQWIASAKSGEPRGRNYVSTARTVRTDNYYDDPSQNIVAYRQPRPDYDYDAAYQSDSKFAREPWDDDAYGTTHRAAPRVTDLERFESRQRRTREDVVQKDVDREPVSHREGRKPRPVAGESQRASASTKNGRQRTAVAGARFFLDLSSPVVDAPSIGPRVAEKLETIGIDTVEDLLNASAETIASQLDIKRVDGQTIRDWQDQARLVCRIPNLRGHDAQLLVACKVTSPEALARLSPATLLTQVTSVAQSSEGQRMLRGSQAPDLAEVTDWINWSSSSRSLHAA